ncbi:DUF6907 domain-containing protein [Streptomyces candidus]|uniref:Uncharacterized protein n=1 Tax=Streptomyces candidus TaxID=67283 RepID=A0A7X0LRP3_9ACTN|nr:hypothetical protein [Streptomyces candidus]MBB6437191.1 hypothetical protein [Streptomyces candidus]GHH38156.1 hypothetical protein GCM10018773_15680 [Streptomyces candidus]
MQEPTRALRTVTIQTADHGGVTFPEPGWCLGDHEVGGYRADLSHTGREVQLDYDDEALLLASFVQDPFATRGPRTVGLYVEQTGFSRTLDPDEVDQFADALVSHATVLRALPRQLAALRTWEGQ